MQTKKWTRKYKCPHCNVSCGSRHNIKCKLAFSNIGKMKNKENLKTKLIKLLIKWL